MNKKGDLDKFTLGIVIVFIVIALAAGGLILITYGGQTKFGQSLKECKGLCSNQIIAQKEGGVIKGYEAWATCEEVNRRLENLSDQSGKYMKDPLGECEGQAQCCVGLNIDIAGPSVI
ncbi:MAG: hypothetical protein KKE20_04105 [Nanoarchaeota archaeon]|nr:hypothetical protein [Nanoarchaeota archaeon]